MTGVLAIGLVEAALAALVLELVVSIWQLHRYRKTQIEQGLKLDYLTGLMDGRTVKIAQDVAHAVELLLEEKAE